VAIPPIFGYEEKGKMTGPNKFHIVSGNDIQKHRKPFVFRLGFLRPLIFLLILVTLFHVPYFLNMVTIMSRNMINQAKWNNNGSQNYVIRTRLADFSPYRGINTVTVKNEKIINVEPDPENQFPNSDISQTLDSYFDITIEGMFQSGYDCGLQPIKEYWHYWLATFSENSNNYNILWLSCSFDYDPTYGYPTKVIIDCPNPDWCSKEIEVIEVKVATGN